VYWEKAPDYRTSRTLDWLNDACEAKLKKNDRAHGEITYTALMSPASVGFTCRGTALSFDRKRPFTQANRAKLWLGKRQYIRRFPISLLLTTERTTRDDDGKVKQIQPYVLLGTKQWLGRFAAVKSYEPTDIRIFHAVQPVAAIPRVPVRPPTAIWRHLTRRATAVTRDPARQMANQFQCMLHTGTIDLDIRFPTEYEAKVLVEFIESNQKIGLAFMYPQGPSPIGDELL
jgi:hypothetical protein